MEVTDVTLKGKGLSVTDKAVYVELKHGNTKQEDIAEALEISVKSVSRSIQKLKELGLVYVTRTCDECTKLKGKNVYSFENNTGFHNKIHRDIADVIYEEYGETMEEYFGKLNSILDLGYEKMEYIADKAGVNPECVLCAYRMIKGE